MQHRRRGRLDRRARRAEIAALKHRGPTRSIFPHDQGGWRRESPHPVLEACAFLFKLRKLWVVPHPEFGERLTLLGVPAFGGNRQQVPQFHRQRLAA